MLRLRAAEQEVLAIIQQALPGFDAVCMATAARKMGSLPSEPGPTLARHPAILSLAQAIGTPPQCPDRSWLCRTSRKASRQVLVLHDVAARAAGE